MKTKCSSCSNEGNQPKGDLCHACSKGIMSEPTRYVQWHSWAEEKSKISKQKKCAKCGLWNIWRLK